MTNEEKIILNVVAQAIFDKKGFNILALDVKSVSTMTDYFVIAEGSVDRHVRSLATAIQDALIPLGLKVYRIEGEKDGDWIVMDYVDIVIHLFTPELREKYALEELWKKAKIVDLDIKISKETPKS